MSVLMASWDARNTVATDGRWISEGVKIESQIIKSNVKFILSRCGVMVLNGLIICING